jgi:hypothetical protein
MLLDVTSILSSNWNIQQVFLRVSARIRRLLRQECAMFDLYDAGNGLLVRQAEDFPLAKGFTSNVQISASNSPAGACAARAHPHDLLERADPGL